MGSGMGEQGNKAALLGVGANKSARDGALNANES